MSNVYFITGGSGTIGSSVVQILLDSGDNEIRLLIRANTKSELREKMENLYEFWGYSLDDDRINRIVTITGDSSEPDFSLDPDTYISLVDECTHIIHCAGAVRMNLPIEQARKSAVSSARQIVKLAKSCHERGRLKKVEVVSTLGINGKCPNPLAESWSIDGKEYHNTYEQSKAEAEDYLSNYPDLPLTVHRPSMVVGNSKTGNIIRFQIFYHICEFLSGRRTWGFFPYLGDAYLDTVPVDYVCRAICWSSTQNRTAGKILHLCSGPEMRVPLLELSERVHKKFLNAGLKVSKLKFFPLRLIFALIPVLVTFAPQNLKKSVQTLPLLLEYLLTNQIFLNGDSQKLLEEAGIRLPVPHEYLDPVLDNYLSQTYVAK